MGEETCEVIKGSTVKNHLRLFIRSSNYVAQSPQSCSL